MTRLSIVIIILLTSIALIVRPGSPLAAEWQRDPFHFLQPTIQLTEEERRRLEEREVVVRILPASGHELAFLTAGALEVGALAMLIFARDQVVSSFSAPTSTTYMWAYPVAVINGFLLSLAISRLVVRRPGFVAWLVSMSFGFLNGCILFVLTT